MLSSTTADEVSIIVIDDDKTKAREQHLLHLASFYGKANVVANLCKNKIRVNLQDDDGRTLLHYAAWFGDVDTLTELLANDDIQVNLPDNRGWTPLHYAAFHKCVGATTALLKRKDIDVNPTDKDGKVPLSFGVFCAEVVTEFMQHPDVNANQQDEQGNAPLHCAVEKNMGKAVAVLVSHAKINVNLTNKKGWTPLALAGYHKDGSSAGELLKHKDLQAKLKTRYDWSATGYDWNAIYYALKAGYKKEAKEFLHRYIAKYYNRRDNGEAYLTKFGKFLGKEKLAKLAATDFLLKNLDKLDSIEIEQVEDFKAHKSALSGGELGNVFSLLRNK